MFRALKKLFAPKPKFKPGPPPPSRLVITRSCIEGLGECLSPEIDRGHEGIAYLLGQSDGTTTVAVAAIRPKARTTRGSFAVEAPAMARVVRAAVDRGLQVVGQVHTHPGEAYHSDGDNDGAKIAFTGYVSVVLPDYGRQLPALTGAATYFFQAGSRFIPMAPDAITVISGRVE
ncbi:Mov34/MPN/PAD-1 family protein [Albidovulum sediminicola]|uniref:Mov34/MPN/PAD-1 family protein n=1 Tax=Albidovulum sediminicola TaxID=2984331 RepID=A0ABT2YZV2_9RHOB|nr:Mov34/MPN/PAD-1 family protein [Defluviimonas sp. WL0075]MCV2864409.1 Mov34/MPN/PAD-1 family protein [Defluviimonas sp. WL0075]